MTRVQAAKNIVDHLMKEGRIDDAAFSSYNPMHCEYGIKYLGAHKIGNISLTHFEISEVEEYCRRNHGFDPKAQRIDWAKRNEDRVMNLTIG